MTFSEAQPALAAPLNPEQTAALTRIWNNAQGATTDPQQHWDSDQQTVFALGLGMQELLQHLFYKKPSLPAFLHWAARNRSSTEGTADVADDTLSPEDLAHWNENGYVVIRNAVPPEVVAAAATAIWQFLGASPEDPASWYQPHEAKSGMMLVLTQHPALAAVRRSVRIRRAYEQLYGTDRIYTVIDKVSFNPPERPGYSFLGSPLHWDTSLALPIPLRLQGLLYLSATTAAGGAFRCVPGFQHSLGPWLSSLPAGTDPREAAPAQLDPIAVEGAAGDFIIWHSALPHCAAPNRGQQPRLVQYLTYLPEGFEDHRPWR